MARMRPETLIRRGLNKLPHATTAEQKTAIEQVARQFGVKAAYIRKMVSRDRRKFFDGTSSVERMLAKLRRKWPTTPVSLRETCDLMECSPFNVRRLIKARLLPKLPVSRDFWRDWFKDFGPEIHYCTNPFLGYSDDVPRYKKAPQSAFIRDWGKLGVTADTVPADYQVEFVGHDLSVFDDAHRHLRDKWSECRFKLGCWHRDRVRAGHRARATMRKTGKLARKQRPTGVKHKNWRGLVHDYSGTMEVIRGLIDTGKHQVSLERAGQILGMNIAEMIAMVDDGGIQAVTPRVPPRYRQLYDLKSLEVVKRGQRMKALLRTGVEDSSSDSVPNSPSSSSVDDLRNRRTHAAEGPIYNRKPTGMVCAVFSSWTSVIPAPRTGLTTFPNFGIEFRWNPKFGRGLPSHIPKTSRDQSMVEMIKVARHLQSLSEPIVPGESDAA